MSNIPDNLLYTADHEWIRDEGETCVIGITDHAQDSLGDVTFVELPQVGEQFDAKAVFGVVESVKAASDLYMPVTGEVVEINEELNEFPESVNNTPYESGWMIRVRPTQPLAESGLLSPSAYAGEISD
jgi:glycine cleavage system H protein